MLVWINALAPFVPLFQTLTWAAFIGVTVGAFRKQCRSLLEVVQKRIERGSSIKAGPIELGEDLRQLDYVKPALPESTPRKKLPSGTPDAIDWSSERNSLYENSRGVFLAHLLEPSGVAGQVYDLFVFLVRHKSEDFSDIKSADFFFGHYWGNEVFREEPTNGLIGVSTSAYGPFLCTCRVTFRDGHIALIHRYIDFEMGRVFSESSNRSLQQSRDARRSSHVR